MDQKQLLQFANETPKVLSLLYDLDLMPEQTVDKPAYAMTMNVIAHCVALRAETLRHAASECQRRINPLKAPSYNTACSECQVFIEAEAERLENP